MGKAIKTKDIEKIQDTIRRGIIKDVVGIQERNEARKFAANRGTGSEDCRSDLAFDGLEIGKSS